jgi:hypothetical protein
VRYSAVVTGRDARTGGDPATEAILMAKFTIIKADDVRIDAIRARVQYHRGDDEGAGRSHVETVVRAG